MPTQERRSAPAGLPAAVPDTGADCTRVLGEYDCGNPDHDYSAKLTRFKDLNGASGRDENGLRHYQRWFAGILADILLGDEALTGFCLAVPVPPKLNQDRSDYHLFDLAAEVERELERRGRGDRLEIAFNALRFTGEVPPVKSIGLPDRPCALASRIACTMDLAGRPVLLLDDIIATGATAAECVRALREAGASGVALVALARRVS